VRWVAPSCIRPWFHVGREAVRRRDLRPLNTENGDSLDDRHDENFVLSEKAEVMQKALANCSPPS
jgi:hypothetical protein